jgi:hypothetical protein
MDRTLRVFRSAEEAAHAKREQYRAMTPDERVALTVQLQRYYYEQRADTPRRLPRLLTFVERASS